MSIVGVSVPPIGFPPVAGKSKIVDLTDVEAGEVGSAIGKFLTELQPVAGSRRFAFLPAAGGLAVANWDVTGEPLPLDPVAVGGELSTVGGVATVSVLNPVPVMGGAAIFYGLTMPVGLPVESATLDLIWPVLPTDAPAYVLTLLHDQTADLTALVESVLGGGAAGVAGLVAGLQFGEGFGLTFPNGDSLPLALPESSQSIVLTVNSSGSLVFSGFGGDVLTAAAAAGSYAISYLMLVMGVSESLPTLSIDVGGSTLSGGNGAAELPVDVSDLDTIYRVTSAGMYAGKALKQNDHVIFYNDQADFLIIRLQADFDPDAVADLVAAAIAASLQAGGAIDTAIDEKLQQAAQSGGVVDGAIDTKLQQSVQSGGVVDGAIDTKLQQGVQFGGIVDTAIDSKLQQGVQFGGVVDTAIKQAFSDVPAKRIIPIPADRLPAGFYGNSGSDEVRLLVLNGVVFLHGVIFSTGFTSGNGGFKDLVLFDSSIDNFRLSIHRSVFYFDTAVNILIDDPLSVLAFGSASNAKIAIVKNNSDDFLRIRLQADFAELSGDGNIVLNARIGFFPNFAN